MCQLSLHIKAKEDIKQEREEKTSIGRNTAFVFDSKRCQDEPTLCQSLQRVTAELLLRLQSQKLLQCLQAGTGCAYCPDEMFNGPRCDLYANIIAHGCSARAVITASSNTKFEKMMTMSFLPGEEKMVDVELTNNSKFFNDELQGERISGNLDAPEGGFDAILQAAVCKSAFHYETDGMNVLSGILKRNDELCHLDKKDKYTEDIHQDYPSIPTLIRVLGDHNIIPVFAVTNHSYTYYEELKRYFPIAEVGLLSEDSSNMLQVMDTAFKNIRSKMSIRAANKPKAFETEFLDTDNVVKQYGEFKFNPGKIGKFRMRVKAHRMLDDNPVCESDQADKKGVMRVKPTTFNAGVNVEASILCPICDCEKTILPKADICHKNGNLVCGKLGTFCNCSASTSARDSSQCIAPGKKEPCSGRGDCLACGACVCYNPTSLRDRTANHGSCVMGSCACAKGWGGEACECPKSTDTCLDSKGALSGACEGTKSCIQCQAWKTGEKKDKEKCDTCPFNITLVDELKEDCPAASLLWLLPLLLFLLLLLALLLLCCWKYCACCKACCASCLALLPCCRKGRMVGFKEDEYLLRQSLLTSDHLDTPMVRTGPPKGTDVVRWKITDNDAEKCWKKEYAIMDTVLTAPRSTFPDIVKLTEKNVQSGNEGVESVDVHVPLFVKDEDDDKKQLLVEAVDVPLGIAGIGKRLVNITIIKEHASSIFSFLQPAYTYSRSDGVANIPISREIIENGRTQVTYRTRDQTAKDKKHSLQH
ncbi:hypothetical protein F7725_013751 [Dissostichus mawsoni]|uniref:Integrin beta subunit VWA domain-containing protein n=1 Tax=Dissostichus mawsoni TaxID=36200 RepID=A0A7J5YV27_DISMA|nr:hypothetical protein F7725_013751 [Dissostichus mawsoni]